MTAPQDSAEAALRASTADDCVVLVDEVVHADLRWADNAPTTAATARTRELTVISIVRGTRGTSAGVVTRQGFAERDVPDVVAASERAARAHPPAEDAQPLVPATSAAPGWADPPGEPAPGMFDRFAACLGTALRRARAEQRLLYGYAAHRHRTTYLASSAGLRLRHEQPDGHVEIQARTADHGASAWLGRATTDFTDVDPELLEEELRVRLGWSGRQIALPPGEYEAVLPPDCVADLMVHLYWSATARDAHEGRSAFGGPDGAAIGRRFARLPLDLRSDPGAPGMACAPFLLARSSDGRTSVFDNGIPLAPTRWLTEGVLTALPGTRHAATAAGLAPTPPVDNLILDGRYCAGSTADLVGRTERGLLLTSLWYVRDLEPATMLVTGLTRDGVYLVDGGEIVGAVNNFRFNESPPELLGRALEAGRSERALAREAGPSFPRTSMPALRVADFPMVAVSPAI